MHVTIQFLSYPKDTKEAKNNIGVCVGEKRGRECQDFHTAVKDFMSYYANCLPFSPVILE